MRKIWLNKKKLIIISSVVILMIILMTIFWISISTRTSFYNGISIDGINISGLENYEAKVLIEENVNKLYMENFIELTYENSIWPLKISELDISFDLDNALEKAYNIGRSGNVFKKLNSIISVRRKKIDLPLNISINTQKVKNLLKNIKNDIDQNEKSATIAYSKGTILINKEVYGKILDIDKNSIIIENNLIGKNFEKINLIVDEKIPIMIYNDIKDL